MMMVEGGGCRGLPYANVKLQLFSSITSANKLERGLYAGYLVK